MLEHCSWLRLSENNGLIPTTNERAIKFRIAHCEKRPSCPAVTSFVWKLVLVPPGAVDVDIHQNREGRAHPSPFTVTRLHALCLACEFDRPLIVEALARLRSRSCIIDGEAVACDGSGIAQFNRIRYRSHDGTVFLYAFDLIELNGDDLRRDPLREVRKATLASVLAKTAAGIRFNEHIECDDGKNLCSATRASSGWWRKIRVGLTL